MTIGVDNFTVPDEIRFLLKELPRINYEDKLRTYINIRPRLLVIRVLLSARVRGLAIS